MFEYLKSKFTFHKLSWLEYAAIFFGFWFLVFPKPYFILFTILLIIPIAGIYLNSLNGKPSIATLVDVRTDADGEVKYDVADFINFPALVILIRIIKDVEFESFYSMIIPGTVACVLMLIFLFSTHKLIEKTQKSKLWIYTSLIFNVSLYSYVGIYGANCVYDFSEPEVYKTKVLNKRISHGRRHTSYYLTVAPWGHHYDKEEISVTAKQYRNTEGGEYVKIDYRKGLFGIPWYYIEE